MKNNSSIKNKLLKILKSIGWIVFYFWEFIVLFLVIFTFYFEFTTRISPPVIDDMSAMEWSIESLGENKAIAKNGWVRPVQENIYEVYVTGSPFERGATYGRLLENQVQKQEDIFVAQFERFIPSKPLMLLVGNLIRWFNQDITDFIDDEYQKEIYGISQSFSNKYGIIGSPYQRILNYHAAHDIGHALNDYQIVGCTSFALNNSRSYDGTLLIGRNFDFYVGEEFAKEKVVLIEKPKEGYGFVSYSWAGFVGVASGMNETGLSVTINASKSELPTASKTPISLLAREILQYASNIEEAIAIAKSRDVFVSESILIGSAKDKRSVIIEKAPDGMDVYDPQTDVMVCSNHYQSDYFKNSEVNLENIKESDSKYRFDRVEELLARYEQLSPNDVVSILRNQKGANDKDIGKANPKALNQLIAHHSVVFQPEHKLMWISMPPYQMGKFICYDMNKIFGEGELTIESSLIRDTLTISADPYLKTSDWKDFERYLEYKLAIIGFVSFGEDLTLSENEIEAFIASNTNSYLPYIYLGDYYLAKEDKATAIRYYEKALTFEMSSNKDRFALEEKIKKLENE